MTRILLVLHRIWNGLRHPIKWLDHWWRNRRKRIDRGPANFCALIGLVLPAFSIVWQGPVPSSSLTQMSDELQIAMCACIFVGGLWKLHGVLCGSRWWFPRKPLKHCYQYGYQGAPIITSGLFVYGWYLAASTPNFLSALGTVLAPLLGLGIGLQGVEYWLEVRCMEDEEHVRLAIKQIVQDKNS